ncbi:unnamed protein product [Oppiella nova]|uniref:Uncharacterized protein n=1 Tax=Oppiella nova TaxID=334625 RepID=A0A7R9MFR6_9ACAR|nr:unnamed protein product [Oppiella nova]CAG2176249.1 unnamed protein product [Oppiella nova]
MLMTIVLLFAVCWLPIHVFSLLVYFYPKFLKMNLRSLLNRCYLTFKVCRSEEEDELETQGQTLSSMNTKYNRTNNKHMNGKDVKTIERQIETEI